VVSLGTEDLKLELRAVAAHLWAWAQLATSWLSATLLGVTLGVKRHAKRAAYGKTIRGSKADSTVVDAESCMV
jgi:hypothetical protein